MTEIKHDAVIGDKVEYQKRDWEVVGIENLLILKSKDGKDVITVRGKDADNVEWIGTSWI